MPPFKAMVENVRFHHSFFGTETSVELSLMRQDFGMPLIVKSEPTDRDAIGFGHSLLVEYTYVFPQAYGEYVNRTNAIAK